MNRLTLCSALLLVCVQPCAASSADVATISLRPSATENENDSVLRTRVRALRDGVRDVPLPLIIEEFSGHSVLPWRGESRDDLIAVGDELLAAINREGVFARRVNEAGNAVEAHVLAALQARGFRAGRPAGPSGRVTAAGYPDLEAEPADGGESFYIEVKTYSARTVDTTQRSFYLSPTADFKITRPAIHLLLAVELEPVENQHYRAARVRWLDLSGLRCDLKHEFNASNRDLYRGEAGLIILEQSAPRAADSETSR